jgi:class 3 adenylate cyclase
VPQPSPIAYARQGDAFVAFRTCGNGPPDLLLVNDWFSHVGDLWSDQSPFRPVLDRLATLGRLITFDKLGVGLSDPVALGALPTLEEWIDDMRAVLDTLGVDRSIIIGKGAGAPMALLFAAMHPNRVSSVVLVDGWARLSQADDFPIGTPVPDQARMLDEPYMPPESVRFVAGEPLSPEVQQWWQSYVRNAASPSTSMKMRRWLFDVDVRAALPSVRAQVLVIARRDGWIGRAHGEYLADAIPGARLVDLPGAANFLFAGDTDALVDEVQELVTGARPQPRENRVLATILYTDLVESTRTVSELGDSRWRALLDQHDRLVRVALRSKSGREINTRGDGFLATFDGPARAIHCAMQIRESVHSIGLEVRCGLHTGEIELRGDDIGGIAAHVGARIEALAEPGEIVVSRTVRDLVAGSGIRFVDFGSHVLKGVPDEWQLYAVAGDATGD